MKIFIILSILFTLLFGGSLFFLVSNSAKSKIYNKSNSNIVENSKESNLFSTNDNFNNSLKLLNATNFSPISSSNTVPTKNSTNNNSTILKSKSSQSNNQVTKWSNLQLQDFGTNPKVPILMYHSIDTFESISKNDKNPRMSRNLRIPPAILLKNLDTIKQKGYTTITLADLQLFADKKQKIPAKSIILTFDDGWADNWQAFELLKKEQAVASFGIVASLINQPNRLTATQLKTMSEADMDIVSHSFSHFNLARMNHLDLDRDLRESKVTLEKITNKTIESLIYPSGAYNSNVINIAQKNGYKIGVTTLAYSPNKGLNLNQPFELTRVRMECSFNSNPRSGECANSGSDFLQKMN
jgi:peptidoglycan/xylan/chitin deacetylase (PgdA/CDA1 family)